MTEEKDFLRELISVSGKSLEVSGICKKFGACEAYTGEDHDKYSRDEMPLQEIEAFERHCEVCPACLAALAEREKSMVSKRDSIDDGLLHKTMNLLDELDGKSDENILSVVIRKSKEILELIRTSGKVLSQPTLAAVRGRENGITPREHIQIIKELERPRISIEMTFEKIDWGETALTISLYDPEEEKFLSDINITINGPGFKKQKTSDETGQVTFSLRNSGNYQATVGSEIEKITTLKISIVDSGG